MLVVKIERKLWFWEKKRFQKLIHFIENCGKQYVSHVSKDVGNILEGKYKVGEGGSHIWIHRNGGNNRLAIIHEQEQP